MNVIGAIRGEPDIALEELGEAPHSQSLAEDIVFFWSLVHGFAHLEIEGQLGGFARRMGGSDFVERVWAHFAPRAVGALNRRGPGLSCDGQGRRRLTYRDVAP